MNFRQKNKICGRVGVHNHTPQMSQTLWFQVWASTLKKQTLKASILMVNISQRAIIYLKRVPKSRLRWTYGQDKLCMEKSMIR